MSEEISNNGLFILNENNEKNTDINKLIINLNSLKDNLHDKIFFNKVENKLTLRKNNYKTKTNKKYNIKDNINLFLSQKEFIEDSFLDDIINYRLTFKVFDNGLVLRDKLDQNLLKFYQDYNDLKKLVKNSDIKLTLEYEIQKVNLVESIIPFILEKLKNLSVENDLLILEDLILILIILSEENILRKMINPNFNKQSLSFYPIVFILEFLHKKRYLYLLNVTFYNVYNFLLNSNKKESFTVKQSISFINSLMEVFKNIIYHPPSYSDRVYCPIEAYLQNNYISRKHCINYSEILKMFTDYYNLRNVEYSLSIIGLFIITNFDELIEIKNTEMKNDELNCRKLKFLLTEILFQNGLVNSIIISLYIEIKEKFNIDSISLFEEIILHNNIDNKMMISLDFFKNSFSTNLICWFISVLTSNLFCIKKLKSINSSSKFEEINDDIDYFNGDFKLKISLIVINLYIFTNLEKKINIDSINPLEIYESLGDIFLFLSEISIFINKGNEHILIKSFRDYGFLNVINSYLCEIKFLNMVFKLNLENEIVINSIFNIFYYYSLEIPLSLMYDYDNNPIVMNLDFLSIEVKYPPFIIIQVLLNFLSTKDYNEKSSDILIKLMRAYCLESNKNTIGIDIFLENGLLGFFEYCLESHSNLKTITQIIIAIFEILKSQGKISLIESLKLKIFHEKFISLLFFTFHNVNKINEIENLLFIFDNFLIFLLSKNEDFLTSNFNQAYLNLIELFKFNIIDFKIIELFEFFIDKFKNSDKICDFLDFIEKILLRTNELMKLNL